MHIVFKLHLQWRYDRDVLAYRVQVHVPRVRGCRDPAGGALPFTIAPNDHDNPDADDDADDDDKRDEDDRAHADGQRHRQRLLRHHRPPTLAGRQRRRRPFIDCHRGRRR